MCLYVKVRKYLGVMQECLAHTCGAKRTGSGLSLPSTLFEAGSLCCLLLSAPAGQRASVPCCLIGTLTPQTCSSVCLYTGSGGPTQILMIAQQISHPLSHLPSPFINSLSESYAHDDLGLCPLVFRSSLVGYYATKRLIYKSCHCL